MGLPPLATLPHTRPRGESRRRSPRPLEPAVWLVAGLGRRPHPADEAARRPPGGHGLLLGAPAPLYQDSQRGQCQNGATGKQPVRPSHVNVTHPPREIPADAY
jgi:hypothetical protein